MFVKGLVLLLVSCVALVQCGSLLPAFLEKVESAASRPLPKRIERNDSRLLFVAGLEGSGHHGMADMFRLCAKIAFCKREDVLSGLTVSFNNSLQKSVGLFAGEDGPNNHANIQQMLDRMRAMSNTTGDFPRTLYYLGLSDEMAASGENVQFKCRSPSTTGFYYSFLASTPMSGVHPGMLSYPNGPSKHKALDRPDLFILASLAETAQVDMRFLVLIRSAEASLRSTMDHRGFGALQPQVLVASAEALYAQISLVSGAFYKCVNYEDLVYRGLNAEQKHSLIEFLHPNLIEHNSGLLDQMLSVVYKGEQKRVISEPTSLHHNNTHGVDRAYHILQLQNRLNLIKRKCSTERAWL